MGALPWAVSTVATLRLMKAQPFGSTFRSTHPVQPGDIVVVRMGHEATNPTMMNSQPSTVT